VFAKIGYKARMVSHGVRHTASTLLREHGWLKDHVESQLAHVEGGIAGEYNQALYLTQRRIMMQWYADYLDALRIGLTASLRDQFDTRVNQFLSRKSSELLGSTRSVAASAPWKMSVAHSSANTPVKSPQLCLSRGSFQTGLQSRPVWMDLT
jgi:hypothetical protein